MSISKLMADVCWKVRSAQNRKVTRGIKGVFLSLALMASCPPRGPSVMPFFQWNQLAVDQIC